MLIGVLTIDSIEKTEETILALPKEHYDAFEFRLDSCKDIDASALRAVLALIQHPVIFTLRSVSQGGLYSGTEAQRLNTLMALADLAPTYVDIEYDVDPIWLKTFQEKYPAIKLILSYHDFECTPDNLDIILQKMKRAAKACFYKIATFANSTLDALRILNFNKTCPESKNLIAISMGKWGESSRILSPIVGSGVSYCGINESTAPGQLTADRLVNMYHFRQLNKETKIYGLIGYPVEQSIGAVFHNEVIRKHQLNAIYVKWAIKPKEIESALMLLNELGVAGLSVTMPLKECILTHVESADSNQRAVNTLVLEAGKWKGYNTDGVGAITALDRSVKDKTVVIIGAGGAAWAIAEEARKKGAHVIILNRTVQKEWGKSFEIYPLTLLFTASDLHYDIMINTLPAEVPLPLSEKSFKAGTLIMDINYYQPSLLLEKAVESGCRCLDGMAMYRQQARLQLNLWFPTLNSTQIKIG